MKRTRRNFIKQSTLAGSALIFPYQGIKSAFLSDNGNTNENLQVHLFSKHLQFLDYNGMSEATAEMGFDGLDLTVRPEGHVLPERVTEDLPKAVEAMRKFGLRPQMMTTNVTDADDQTSRTVLEMASQQGLKYYRTGWLTYPEDRSIDESQSKYAQQFKDLEILNKTQGLIGCYQNHAGNHVGAPIWDLLPILRATKNEHMGAQYDIRHAVVEGGSSWELGLRQIQPYIKSIVIKDFKWGVVNGKWEPINTPLGEGMVDFNRYFSLLKKYKINVPVSLHLEYDLGGAEQGASKITMDKNAIFGQMKKDLRFLREAWQLAE
ncbi:MAG: TIM barrel protein [Maribacter sp.]|uniref:sugar phosphate isomerase/epimerase family protein n=1 Tax=Maribacter sp. TaxID=1897614 RepID=UPI003C76A1D9